MIAGFFFFGTVKNVLSILPSGMCFSHFMVCTADM